MLASLLQSFQHKRSPLQKHAQHGPFCVPGLHWCDPKTHDSFIAGKHAEDICNIALSYLEPRICMPSFSGFLSAFHYQTLLQIVIGLASANRLFRQLPVVQSWLGWTQARPKFPAWTSVLHTDISEAGHNTLAAETRQCYESTLCYLLQKLK